MIQDEFMVDPNLANKETLNIIKIHHYRKKEKEKKKKKKHGTDTNTYLHKNTHKHTIKIETHTTTHLTEKYTHLLFMLCEHSLFYDLASQKYCQTILNI